jgi:hypothetical protein
VSDQTAAGLLVLILVVVLLLLGCDDAGPEHRIANAHYAECVRLYGTKWCGADNGDGQANYHKPNYGKP